MFLINKRITLLAWIPSISQSRVYPNLIMFSLYGTLLMPRPEYSVRNDPRLHRQSVATMWTPAFWSCPAISVSQALIETANTSSYLPKTRLNNKRKNDGVFIDALLSLPASSCIMQGPWCRMWSQPQEKAMRSWLRTQHCTEEIVCDGESDFHVPSSFNSYTRCNSNRK